MNQAVGRLMMALLAAGAPPAAAQDLSGDLLNVVYDLSSPKALGTESLPLEARRALDTLRTEKLLPAQRLPATTRGPLIDLWGRALIMGTRAPQFARAKSARYATPP